MAATTAVAFVLAYQLSPRAHVPVARSSASGITMQYQLGNFILDGPLRALNNQVTNKHFQPCPHSACLLSATATAHAHPARKQSVPSAALKIR